MEDIESIIEAVEALPHASPCMSEFAPNHCDCARGEALSALENLQSAD